MSLRASFLFAGGLVGRVMEREAAVGADLDVQQVRVKACDTCWLHYRYS